MYSSEVTECQKEIRRLRSVVRELEHGYIEAETVTGYVGQVLDECDIDEQARRLLTELYNEAVKEMEE